jgi:hypothetical protein
LLKTKHLDTPSRSICAIYFTFRACLGKEVGRADALEADQLLGI